MGLPRIFVIATIAVVAILPCSRGEWAYPNIDVREGPLEEARHSILTIHSENTATVSYDISGDYTNEFEIDHVTGNIYQVEPLDREAKPQYDITAKSFDKNNEPTEEDVSFKVIVTDINDEKPVFDESTLTGTIEEGHDKGADSLSFMRIQASDKDTGYRGDVRYSIKAYSDTPSPTSTGNRFSIDSITGNVKLMGDLDYESDREVRFMVVATDGGGRTDVATFSTEKEVVVRVTDSNDHAPVIDPLADKSLSEVSKLNTPLYNIYASDEDEDVNKKVYFEIISGNAGGTFTIVSKPSDTGKSMGQLMLLKNLDFESGVTKYTLNIKAYNKEASNADAYSSTAPLKITVIDANEPPIFTNTPYSGVVTEGVVVEEPIPVVTVSAVDKDFGGNQSVTFSLSDPENWFQVDPILGYVSLGKKVDREAQSVENGVYELKVVATDNYDNGAHESGSEIIFITIIDINDNPPMPDWGQDSDTAVICEKPVNETVKFITATDPDSAVNGPKFNYRFDDSVDNSLWGFEEVNDLSQKVVAKFSDYGLSSGSATVALIFTITDSGTVPQTGTATLTVTVCKCGDDGRTQCSGATAAGFPVAIIIAIIAVILLIAILVFAVVAYRRRQDAMILKEPFFDDEDDIRETVQVYQEECGEEDQDAYDLSALRAPLMAPPNQPVRKEIVPIQQASRPPRTNPPDDIGNIIGEAKDIADGDPSAPPFDSLLVFDYEGAGSDAGSLSSINTATTDGSVDYDYLNEWGPRFKRLADMYNDGSESE